jgi:hypothetical protein
MLSSKLQLKAQMQFFKIIAAAVLMSHGFFSLRNHLLSMGGGAAGN